MICPRCGKDIPDAETMCPFCMQEIDHNFEFNDFREDGFVQLQPKDASASNQPQSYKPKYFDISEYNIFIIAIVFVLCVSLFTIFSLRFVQKRAKEVVPKYVSTEPLTEATPATEPTTANTVKSYDIKDLLGSWKFAGDEEDDYTAIPYYTFKEKGYLRENYGSMVTEGSYVDLSKGKDKAVYLSIDSNIRGGYDFELVGNKDSGYAIILTDQNSGAEYTLVKADAKMKKLTPIPNHKLDNSVLGTWYTKEKDKAYKFTERGTLKRITGRTTTYAVWTIEKKGEITIKYMKDEIKTVVVPYKLLIKNKKLMVNGTIYYKK